MVLTGVRAPDSIRVWLVSDGRMRVLKTFRGVGAEILVAPGGKGLAFLDGRSQVLRLFPSGGGRAITLANEGCILGTCTEPSFSWSPRGTRLAVASVIAGASKVRVYSASGVLLDDITPRLLAPSTFYGSVRWSPDGRWLGFTRLEGEAGTSTCCKLDYLVMHPNGTSLTAVASFKDAIKDYPTVTWAPNGRRIVLSTEAFDPRDPAFAVVSIPSGKLRRLATMPADVVWSPDSTKLAFTAGNRIHIVTALGKPVRTLRPFADSIDAWLPDGSILFNQILPSGQVFRI